MYFLGKDLEDNWWPINIADTLGIHSILVINSSFVVFFNQITHTYCRCLVPMMTIAKVASSVTKIVDNLAYNFILTLILCCGTYFNS